MNGIKKKNNLEGTKIEECGVKCFDDLYGAKDTMTKSRFEKNAIDGSVQEKVMKRKP